jgi:hypothetical protein
MNAKTFAAAALAALILDPLALFGTARTPEKVFRSIALQECACVTGPCTAAPARPPPCCSQALEPEVQQLGRYVQVRPCAKPACTLAHQPRCQPAQLLWPSQQDPECLCQALAPTAVGRPRQRHLRPCDPGTRRQRPRCAGRRHQAAPARRLCELPLPLPAPPCLGAAPAHAVGRCRTALPALPATPGKQAALWPWPDP